MAFTDLGSLGATGSTSNNQSQLDLATAAAIAVGDFVVVVVGADNIANGGDDNACSGVTLGVGGQALNKRIQIANALAAQAGASVSIWYGQATAALGSGGTIRATFGSGTLVDASAMTARKYSVTAGMAVDVEQAAATLVSNTAADPGSLNVTTGLDTIVASILGASNVNGTGLNFAVGQAFTNVAQALIISSIDVWMCKSGTPTGSMYLEVTSTDPGGAVVATSDLVACSTITATTAATSTAIRFTFPTPPTISASATFGVRIWRTDADATNRPQVAIGVGSGNGINNWLYNGTSWATSGTSDDYKIVINNVECLRIRGIASQVGNNTNLTPTASWTAWANGNSAATGTTGEICARAESRINTATSAASDPTYVSAIYASAYAAFKEVLPPPSPADGSASGTGSASATSAVIIAATGSAAGTGTASGVAAATVPPWVRSGAAFDLDFANAQYYGGALSGLLANSNSTGGYATNVDGSLTWFAPNTPRVGTGKGLLIEEARTNVLKYSQDFSNAIWVTQSNGTGTVSITANDAVAPDGTTTADKFTCFRDASNFWAAKTQDFTGTAALYAFTIYLKAHAGGDVGKRIVLMSHDGTGATSHVEVVLTANWQRITHFDTLTAAANCWLGLGLFDDGNFGISGAQTGTVEFDAWGAQVELVPYASFATSQIPTTSAAVTRSADDVTWTGAALTLITGSALSAVNDLSDIPTGYPGTILNRSGGGYAAAVNNGQFGVNAVFSSDGSTNLTHSVSAGWWVPSHAAAFGFNSSGRTIAGNGTSSTDTTVVLPLNNHYGCNDGTYTNGYHQRISLWDSRLADATLAAYTVVVLDTGAGSASGSGTATAIGRSTAASAGSASGAGTAHAIAVAPPAEIYPAFSPQASGAQVTFNFGVGGIAYAGIAPAGFLNWDDSVPVSNNAVGSAAGIGSASAVGQATAAALGSASGTGSASGASSAATTANGVGSAAGSGTASAQGNALLIATGSGTGSGTASAAGRATAVSAGSASSTSAASSVGRALFSGTGAGSGTSTATASGAGLGVAVGSAAGIGSATATGRATTAAAGAASGTGGASAIGVGLFNGVGSASGIGSATAPGRLSVAAAGSASSTSSATAVGRSTAASVGGAAGRGSATAFADSGVAMGAAAGVGAATGVGRALFNAVGAASAAGAASAVSAVAVAAVGSAAGSGSASAVGRAMSAAAGAATASGTATAVGRATAVSVGSASGTSTAGAQSQATGTYIGATSGAGAASAVGRTLFSGIGAASGLGSASATSAVVAASIGGASSVGTANAVGLALKPAVGSAAGSGTATAPGQALSGNIGAASGTGSATAVGRSTAASAGAASGIGSATAVGTSVVVTYVGSASGTGSAAGIGRSTAVSAGSAAGTATAFAIAGSTAAAVGSASGEGRASAHGLTVYPTPPEPERIVSVSEEVRAVEVSPVENVAEPAEQERIAVTSEQSRAA